MTVDDLEHLIRRVRDVLREPEDAPLAPRLVAEFADACHALNLRIQQFETLIKTGDREAAIQLSETTPNLVDCVEVLEFKEADQWRAFCEKQGLAVAEKLDANSVRALRECYAQGITRDHPLYALYRGAVLSRRDNEALKALQSITRLNPADANAASELIRLDAKVLQAGLRRLADLVAAGNPRLVVSQIEGIEAFGFKSRPDGETWREGQSIRCRMLLDQAEESRASSNWLDALSKLDFILRLREQHRLELPAGCETRIAALADWARVEQQKDRRERQFQSHLTELRHRIQKSEEKDTAARDVDLGEIKEDWEGLHKVWHALEDFTRPIPEETKAAFHKRSDLLQAEIARRTAVRRRLIMAGVVAVLVLGGLISRFALNQLRAQYYSRNLNAAIAERRVRTAEQLLQQLRGRDRRLLGGRAVDEAVATADSMVSREQNLLANFENAMSNLPGDFASGPSVAVLAAQSSQVANARTCLTALAPDLRAENEPKMQSFERKWQNYLIQCGEAANRSLEQMVETAEKECLGLDYQLPVDEARLHIAVVSNQVRQIDDFEADYTNRLELRSDLLQRAAGIQSRFGAYNDELTKLDTALSALRNSRTTRSYMEAVSTAASSEFSADPLTKAAQAVQAVDPNEESALRFLLGATNAGMWAFLKQSDSHRFIPSSVFPAELAILDQLNGDPAVNASYQRVRLWLDSQGSRFLDWIVAGSFSHDIGWTNIMAYEPSNSPTVCDFRARDYGYFDGGFRLSPTRPVYEIQPMEPCNQTAAFRSVGLETVIAGSAYNRPLLEVLDAVKDSTDGSPVFRAYLFLRIVKIMELQPEAWGLVFAPSISAHCRGIREIAGGDISSGDWFVQSKATAWAGKLENLMASARKISYTRQATGMFTLARDVSHAGFQFAGFLALDGKPVLFGHPPPERFWGHGANQKEPVLLGPGARSNGASIDPGLPLSPLYVLSLPAGQLFAAAGIDPSAPDFLDVLPPLFADAGPVPSSDTRGSVPPARQE